MGYFDFEKKSEFMICIDSDGCAMDTMEVKHRECFGPQWIKTYGLDAYKDECMELWLSMNLYSITRGVNRFKGLAMALLEVEKRGIAHIEGLKEFASWTKEAGELSNPSLTAALQEGQNKGRTKGEEAFCFDCMERALLWSIRTNRAINELPADDAPFPNVKWTMDEMCRTADLTAVSSANGEAVQAEWSKHHLAEDCRMLLTQEAGSKAYCIGELLKMGYDADKVLMVGDAPGDRDAAAKNGVRFYPILVGKEGNSWSRLLDEAYPRFLAGEFDEVYQQKLIADFENNLGV